MNVNIYLYPNYNYNMSVKGHLVVLCDRPNVIEHDEDRYMLFWLLRKGVRQKEKRQPCMSMSPMSVGIVEIAKVGLELGQLSL